jgi:hypothetical protein
MKQLGLSPAMAPSATHADTTVRVRQSPGSEPACRYSDDFRKVLRIHTKLVGT